MMRRTLALIVILLVTLSAEAVLKEKDLPKALQILRTELASYHREMWQQIEQNRKHHALHSGNQLFKKPFGTHEPLAAVEKEHDNDCPDKAAGCVYGKTTNTDASEKD